MLGRRGLGGSELWDAGLVSPGAGGQRGPSRADF